MNFSSVSIGPVRARPKEVHSYFRIYMKIIFRESQLRLVEPLSLQAWSDDFRAATLLRSRLPVLHRDRLLAHRVVQ
jgi:hypothetical protein